MLGYSRGGFEKEGLFGEYVIEKELLDGSLSTPALG